VELDASGSEDNVAVVRWTYSFDYAGTVVRLDGPRSNFTFDILGTFVVVLFVHDAAGNLGTDELLVTVKDVTAPVASAGPDRTMGQDEQVVLDGTASWDNVGIASYVWTVMPGDSQHVLTGALARVTFARVGVYTIVLNVTDSSGNWDLDELIVTVRDTTAPFAEAGPDQEVDPGERVTLNGTASLDNEGIVNWTWRFMYRGTETVLQGALPAFNFSEPGDYLVTLTVADKEGNNASDVMHVRVKAPHIAHQEVDPAPYLIVATALAIMALLWVFLRGRRRAKEAELSVVQEA
jgi:hypothetical protein